MPRSFHRWAALLGLVFCCSAHALTPEEALGVSSGETDARIEALGKAVANGDDRTLNFLQALSEESVKLVGSKAVVVRDGKALDPVNGTAADLPPDAEDVMLNNRLRGEIDTALATLKLFAADVRVRRQAALSLLKEPDANRLPVLDKALASEKDHAVLTLLRQAHAAAMLSSEDAGKRLAAARSLATSALPEVLLLLNQRTPEESDAAVLARQSPVSS